MCPECVLRCIKHFTGTGHMTLSSAGKFIKQLGGTHMYTMACKQGYQCASMTPDIDLIFLHSF